MKKISRKFSAALISLLSFAGVAIVLACGPIFQADNAYYRFFTPEVIHNDANRPFFRTPDLLFAYGWWGYWESPPQISLDSLNLDEWQGFFGSAISRKELDSLIYKLKLGDIDPLIIKVKDAAYKPKDESREFALLTKADKKAAKEFLYYLGFAKRVENYTSFPTAWNYESKPEDITKAKDEMGKLIAGGLKQLPNASIGFINERYVFQLMKLYFYSQRYREALDYFDKLADFKWNSQSIKYRVTGLAAGAAKALKQYDRANYLYSIVFDHFDAMKASAFLSFKPVEEKDWDQCLAATKNLREKCVMWQILGIKYDGFRAMQEIYKLDPASDLLDLLLVRQVNIEEEKFLPTRWSYDSLTKNFGVTPGTVNPEIMNFIRNTAQKANTHKPALWNLAYGYLCFAQKDFAASKTFIDKAESECHGDAVIKDQIRIIRTVTKLEEIKTIDRKFENDILPDLEWLYSNKPYSMDTIEGVKYGSTLEWTLNRLSEKYTAQGDYLKAELTRYGFNRGFTKSVENVLAITKLLESSGRTPYENFLLKVYPYTLNDAYDLLGVHSFYSNDLETALHYFEKSETVKSQPGGMIRDDYQIVNFGRLNYEPGDYKKPLPGDPFLIHIKDCHDCDHAAKQTIKYTKAAFVKKMIALLIQINSNPPNAAELCFQAANGYYNASYFGNARKFYETGMRYYGLLEYGLPTDEYIFDQTNAEKYYLKAMQLSSNAEFKARCCFMASKCENNRYQLKKNYESGIDFVAGKYFAQLKNEYSNTKYYKEILRECGYFATYANKK